MADDLVNIEVDGVSLKAKKGEMLMRATDRGGIYVPRFCYHEKLAIAANCRMCLVEVEKAPKPLPACATPVAEGMKVFTKSRRAIDAQRATMEFLLINHPLDCPICDQGGECELQDLAVGFGRDISRYQEGKRAVADENLGPLIATDMTRCIQCTRCVRFTEEIAGIQELGMIGRGEHMAVRSYIESTVNHELSGNVIDLCPVGALVAKPSRFGARAWEMSAVPLISPHDAVGSNLFGHVLRGRLMRVLPRENESINEIWIADRDRFSYEGLYSADRLRAPLVRRGGEWVQSEWEPALTLAAERLKERAASFGVLVSPSSTTEELYLAARLARGLGSNNIDHRLRQRDFRDQAADPVFPALGVRIAEVDGLNALLVIGSNLRREAPILAHRVRKAALRGAQVTMLNPARFPYLFPLAGYLSCAPGAMSGELAALLNAAATATGAPVPEHLAAVARAASVTDAHRAAVQALLSGPRRAIWLGALAARHPAFADLRSLAAALAQMCAASYGRIAEGANAAGGYVAGAVPHREPGGKALAQPGLSAREMLGAPLRAYLLLGGIEPGIDTLEPEALRTLAQAEFVIALTPFASEEVKSFAHLILPIGTFAETSGTYVNCEGLWQSQAGAVTPVGVARPGWKVLRVLGNLLKLPRFDYQSSEQVLAELRAQCTALAPGAYSGRHAVPLPDDGARLASPPTVTDVPMYQVDALVRRAVSLQRTRDGRAPIVTY
ncbi:MAG TPA: NADH-quinone oxidoreductase subunit NuoG [Steroidobacteraceae bacterium]|jgi:NADH-quinone oxidoreductase subunit G|nr:NADH-quinone oxidoreductase subunit NuoG [Steroidobacteraceae bacterium]